MARPVLNKQDFVQRYAAGEFGNGPLTWKTLDEFLASGFQGLTHIRNRIKGGRTWYNIPSEEVPNLWKTLISAAVENGVSPETLYLSSMAPEDKKIFQGEVQRGLWGLDLHYNLEAAPMRQVPPECWHDANGVKSLFLLRKYLCPNSYEWLQHLLDEYQNHVVEFSTYSVQWGTIPGYNTVFWEVRAY